MDQNPYESPREINIRGRRRRRLTYNEVVIIVLAVVTLIVFFLPALWMTRFD